MDDPFTAATCLLQKNGLVVGVSRRNNHDDWGLPGGKRDPGESSRQTAARELLEETGIRVRAEDLVPVFSRMHGEWRVITYEASAWEGEPAQQPGDGLAAWIMWPELERGESFGAYNKRLHEVLTTELWIESTDDLVLAHGEQILEKLRRLPVAGGGPPPRPGPLGRWVRSPILSAATLGSMYVLVPWTIAAKADE